jgi:hypothetical protein
LLHGPFLFPRAHSVSEMACIVIFDSDFVDTYCLLYSDAMFNGSKAISVI